MSDVVVSFNGRETRGDVIEVAWCHVRYCPEGHLAEVFRETRKRKGNSRDAIKVVARKLVNVVWAVLTYEQEFMVK